MTTNYRDTLNLPETELSMKAGLPKKEPEIIDFWNSIDLYKKIRSLRTGNEIFILHDGPPYASGSIHLGHSVNKILNEINCHNKYSLMIFNKIDKYKQSEFNDSNKSEKSHFSLLQWRNTWMNKTNGKAIFISAIDKINFENLRKEIYELVRSVDLSHYPKNDFLYPENFSK